MKRVFQKIMATIVLSLVMLWLNSCIGSTNLGGQQAMPECYLTYSEEYSRRAEPPPVFRLNAAECRELLDIEDETEPDTPRLDWQVAAGSPEFLIFPQGEKERSLLAVSKVRNLTHTYIPEAAARLFDALVKSVESRPDSCLSKAEVRSWYKQYRPIRYRFYYKD